MPFSDAPGGRREKRVRGSRVKSDVERRFDIDSDFGETLIHETIGICRIPAPTFGEHNRAHYIAARLRDLGVREVDVDELHNVTALIPSEQAGATVMLVAHIDTVFPEHTDVEPYRNGQHWHAPGIRDNSASAAILLMLPELVRRSGIQLSGNIRLAFSVGEEGLGNLRGIRALMKRYGQDIAAVIAVDGNLGVINHVAITVRRLEIAVRAEGGHSWADAGKPSAVHILARVAAKISEIHVPTAPRSALNIGTISGGTSVNAIAQAGQFALDIRSVERSVVEDLERQVGAIVENAGQEQVSIGVNVIGDRPGGMIPADHALVAAILEGYASVGVKSVALPGSTDANIPLSLGIPAASMGVAAGGRIHTLQEFLDPKSLPIGAGALLKAVVSFQESMKR